MDNHTQSHSTWHENTDVRAEFYRNTYMHLAGAVLAFIIVESILLHLPFVINIMMSLTQGFWWLLLLGGFIFATNYAEKMALSNTDIRKQYIAMGIFILAEAIIFVPLLYIAILVSDAGGANLINQAAILTLSLFTGLSAVVLLTKKDFSFLRSILTIGGFIAIGLIVAGMLFGFNLGLWFSVGMVGLASISILYQTSNMVHKYDESQYVAASLGLFGSLMLLFWYILSFLLNRN